MTDDEPPTTTDESPITGGELIASSWTEGPALGLALNISRRMLKSGSSRAEITPALNHVLANPEDAANRGDWKKLANAVITEKRRSMTPTPPALGQPRPYTIWGAELIDPGAIAQMDMAMSLPISTRGALMPDAHIGYGLPIGGVLETRDVVIPYAVGSDIACRMRLTVLDVPATALDRDHDQLKRALVEGTVFGAGKESPKEAESDILEEDWRVTPFLQGLKDLARKQLGTSGSGNHFVEWGIVNCGDETLLALMSHSGSRGVGFKITGHYSKTAEKLRAWDLPKEALKLSWLELDSDSGREYWQAMELALRFASENHRVIHERVIKLAGLKKFMREVVENHHNFAWVETAPDGSTLVIHRKGATPAGEGVKGVIPGSMATSGYVVAGKGNADSLESASHGAGRAMSRKKAEQTITKTERDRLLKDAQITLIGAGMDEAPQAYKPIDLVIQAQADLVDIIAKFTPRVVRMDTDSQDI